MAKHNFFRIFIFLLLLFSISVSVFAQENSEYSLHTVKKKETLYSISKKYGMTVRELKQLNNLNENTIFVNQSLYVVGYSNASSRSGVTSDFASRGIQFRGTEDPITSSVVLDESWNGYNTRSATTARMGSPSESETTRDLFYRSGEESSQRDKVMVERKQWYQVREGDDIFSIADTYEVGISELQSWNNTQNVRPGDIIVVNKWNEEVDNTSLDEATGRSLYNDDRMQLSSPESQRYLEARNRALSRTTDIESTSRLSLAASELSTNISGAFTNNTVSETGYQIPVVRTSDRMVVYADPSSRKIQESGPYITFEIPGYNRHRFYGAHKILPPGSKVKLDIPNNPGYLEVTIIDRLPVDTQALIGLSPGCIKVIGSAAPGKQVTILYD